MEIGEHITKLRKEKGYSTTKLAKLAGIAQSTLREIELGNTSPTWDTIRKLGDALEVSPIIFAIDPELEPPELTETLIRTSPEIRRIMVKLFKLPPNKLKVLNDVLDTWVETDIRESEKTKRKNRFKPSQLLVGGDKIDLSKTPMAAHIDGDDKVPLTQELEATIIDAIHESRQRKQEREKRKPDKI